MSKKPDCYGTHAVKEAVVCDGCNYGWGCEEYFHKRFLAGEFEAPIPWCDWCGEDYCTCGI